MTRYLKRQAEAAAKKIMGKLPEPKKISIDQWEAKLLNDKKFFEQAKLKTK
jgi:hypothetical protein